MDKEPRKTSGKLPEKFDPFYMEQDPEYRQGDESTSHPPPTSRDDDEVSQVSHRSNDSEIAKLDAERAQKLAETKQRILQEKLELLQKRREEDERWRMSMRKEEDTLYKEMEEASNLAVESEMAQKRASLLQGWDNWDKEVQDQGQDQFQASGSPKSSPAVTPLNRITPPTGLFTDTSLGLETVPSDSHPPPKTVTWNPTPRQHALDQQSTPIFKRKTAPPVPSSKRMTSSGGDGDGDGGSSSSSSSRSNSPERHPYSEASGGSGCNPSGGDEPPNSGGGDKKKTPSDPSQEKDVSQVLASVVEYLMAKDAPASKSQSTQDKFLARQIHGRDLPLFTGNPQDWPMFYSTFVNTSKACDYDDVANLARLQRCLKGDALKLVRGLMTSPGNVPKVMEKLRKSYGRPELIVETLIAEVQSTPSAREDKIESLVTFEAAVSSLVETIKSTGSSDYLNNPLLVKELERKLSSYLRAQWAVWAVSKSRSLSDFAVWISSIVDALQPLHTPKSTTEKKESKRESKSVLSTVEAESSKEEKKEKSDNCKSCSFCQATNHFISGCPDFKKLDPTDRGKWIMEKKKCLNCFSPQHFSKNCTSKNRCRITNCGKKHHSLLHGAEAPPKSTPPPQRLRAEAPPPAPEATSSSHVGQMSATNSRRVLYQVLPVVILGPNKKEKKIFAILDPGSAFTLIEKNLVQEMGLTGKEDWLNFKSVSGIEHGEPSSLLTVRLQNLKTKKVFKITQVNTLDRIDIRGGSLRQSDIEKWRHLRGLDLSTYENAQPQILIGLNNPLMITPTRVVSSSPNAPVAAETPLGWVVYGKLPLVPKDVPIVKSVLHLQSRDTDDELNQLVKSFMSTEDFGIKASSPSPKSQQEARAEEVMQNTIKRVGNHFEVGLLWRSDDVTLPSNREGAMKRLMATERKLDKNPGIAAEHCKKMQHNIDSGYLVKIPPQELKSSSPRLWYLPHFLATRPNRPGKYRLVYDAAAVMSGTSLNANLLKGPDEITPLQHVLCKFRQKKIAISADIREMFPQIHIKKEDQDSQRILWRSMDRDRPPEEYRFTRMTFGATCSPVCSQRIKNLNALEWQRELPAAANAVLNHHYVDNYLDSLDSEEEAMKIAEDVYEVNKRGGFTTCAWVSNSHRVMEEIPEDLRSESQKFFSSKSELEAEKIFGLVWDPNKDEFKFSLSFCALDPEIVCGQKVPTKRQALALTMSLYDPLGFAAFLTVRAKILLQKTWKRGINWDDQLPEDLFAEWKRWIQELQTMSKFAIPRCYSPHFTTADDIQLHVFCDASESAFAAVCYFRTQRQDQVQVAFVEAKTRVTPVKTMTLPRCELQAAVMGCRLAKSIQESHSIQPHKIIYWTDSITVKCWLSMDSSRLKQFVSCRVGEIQEDSEIKNWKWISTKENVADEATRANSKLDISPNSRWINGPAFLLQQEEEWPVDSGSPVEFNPVTLELKKVFIGAVSSVSVVPTLIDPTKFSSWLKLLRVTAWCLRFFSPDKPKKKVLTPSELARAETLWQKWVQQQCYLPECRRLVSQKQIVCGELVRYSPFLDTDGIIKMRSRIPGAINPIILSARHPYTKLLISHHHERANHHGMDRVVNELKSRFAIPTLRASVRRSWFECQQCRNARAKPVPPKMGVLPTARLQSYQRPFTFTGMDYFGPLQVTVGRKHEKRYGALFTCLVTRAVHVELAASLDTDSCINAMRRFFNRRGQPKEIWSDNGTNFVGAERELREELQKLNAGTVQDKMAIRGISWTFIPPHAPHMGGSWERMVRSIKTALYATLKERAPREDTLRTLLTEAEYSVNCHPLAYVSEDPDSPEVLTPNHFLLGPDYHVPPPSTFTDKDLIPGRQWKIAQRLADHFWTRWVREILPTLAQRSKWFQSQSPLQVGDVVILVDDNLPRSQWKLGRVSEIPKSKDGQVRWAVVKTSDSEYKRPAVKLIRLDVRGQDNGVQNTGTPLVTFLHQSNPPVISPKIPNQGLREEINRLKASEDYEDIMSDYVLWTKLIKFRLPV